MFDLFDPGIVAPQRVASIAASANDSHQESERNAVQSGLPLLLAAMLDEIDFGMVLVADDLRVLHANHVARAELDEQHPLQMLGDRLRARRPHDLAPLRDALMGACRHSRRRLVTLGDGAQRVTVAVVPLPTAKPGQPTSALAMLGKRHVCQALSVEAFARSHGLTTAETLVLKALCGGARPSEIAVQHGVALSTVRTQIGSIRAKTGAQSIGSLVRMVAMLPPMVSVLRQAGMPPAHGFQRRTALVAAH